MKRFILTLGVAALVAIQLPACKSSTKQADMEPIADTKGDSSGIPSANDSAAIFAQLLVSDANELNSQCPIMIDKETRLDNAQPMTKENTIRHYYTFVRRV